MDSILCVKKEIEKIIAGSLIPEDPIHSKNTLEWLLKLDPDADEALQIAALGHDIERAIEAKKEKRAKYKNYDEFKKAHALNSAAMLKEIMSQCNAHPELIDNVYYLVCHHETGGIRRANLLKDADSISFFDVNLPFYFARNSVGETKKRFLWGYRRLSENLKKVVGKFHYHDKDLQWLARNCITDSEF
jgi:hypothetical protein